jgi:hypothetical protein
MLLKSKGIGKVSEAKELEHSQSVSKEIRFKSLGAVSLVPPMMIYNIISYEGSTFYLNHRNL